MNVVMSRSSTPYGFCSFASIVKLLIQFVTYNMVSVCLYTYTSQTPSGVVLLNTVVDVNFS